MLTKDDKEIAAKFRRFRIRSLNEEYIDIDHLTFREAHERVKANLTLAASTFPHGLLLSVA